MSALATSHPCLVRQLGLGDLQLRVAPTRITALKGKPIASAATGRAHTIFLGKEGELLASGACKQGACGPNCPKKAEHVHTPVAVVNRGFAYVAAGANFNLAIDTAGDVWSWGWSEHGVLGNGTDHQHNASSGSVKLSYEAKSTPARVGRLHYGPGRALAFGGQGWTVGELGAHATPWARKG